MAEPTYDSACYDLAEHFLKDEPARDNPEQYKQYCHKLAIAIQRTVEDWLSFDDDAPPSTRTQE